MARLQHPKRTDIVVDVDGNDAQLLAYYAGEGYVELAEPDAEQAQAEPGGSAPQGDAADLDLG